MGHVLGSRAGGAMAARRHRAVSAAALLLAAALSAGLLHPSPTSAQPPPIAVDQVSIESATLTLSGSWQPLGGRCAPETGERYSVRISWGDYQVTEFPVICPAGPWHASHVYPQPGAFSLCARLDRVDRGGRQESEVCHVVSVTWPTATPSPAATPTPRPASTPTVAATPEDGGFLDLDDTGVRWGLVGVAVAASVAAVAAGAAVVDAIRLYRR